MKKNVRIVAASFGLAVLIVAVLGVAFPQQVTATVHCQTGERAVGAYVETPLYEGWSEFVYAGNDQSTIELVHKRIFFLGWQVHHGCGALEETNSAGQPEVRWRTNNRSDTSWLRSHRDLVCDAPPGGEHQTVFGHCVDR